MPRHQHDEVLKDYRRDLIQQLRQRRVDLGLSQRDLAERVGVQQSSISAIEAGTVAPTLDTFIALVHALGFSVMSQKRMPTGRHE